MATLHEKRQYLGVLVGAGIRKSIGQDKTYRIRRGNGFYGSIDGEIYQDKYDYFVPTSITDAAGDASRTCFTNAITAWQTLSDAQKVVYQRRAVHGLQMSGYNLFIREYMQDNY